MSLSVATRCCTNFYPWLDDECWNAFYFKHYSIIASAMILVITTIVTLQAIAVRTGRSFSEFAFLVTIFASSLVHIVLAVKFFHKPKLAIPSMRRMCFQRDGLGKHKLLKSRVARKLRKVDVKL
jgi:hypothetical protein